MVDIESKRVRADDIGAGARSACDDIPARGVRERV